MTSAWLCMRERVLVQLLGSVADLVVGDDHEQVGMVVGFAGRGPFVRECSFVIVVNMGPIRDIAAIHIPCPPGSVTPGDCFPDALEQALKDCEEYAESLQALCHELKEGPLLVALDGVPRDGVADQP
ncbi:hypothetical protein ABT187_46590 [Streptomyces sp. NPDC001817]|uniref:hypothetical protein n=1 Tax=Streptomyces sp. NPDC001817 TaxID=3154398 RepID=UPI003320D01A